MSGSEHHLKDAESAISDANDAATNNRPLESHQIFMFVSTRRKTRVSSQCLTFTQMFWSLTVVHYPYQCSSNRTTSTIKRCDIILRRIDIATS